MINEEVKNINIESLPEYLTKIMEDPNLDYESVVIGIIDGMMATFYAMNNHPNGGITGFQANFIASQVFINIKYPNLKTAIRCINYDDMLYPQYKDKFRKTLSKDAWEEIKNTAKENLKSVPNAHPKVIKHWRKIAKGKIPFGYKLKKKEG